jgi:hypothetical protein
VDAWYALLGLSIENLTREQKYEFVSRTLDNKARFARLITITLAVAVVFVICFASTAWAYDGQEPPSKPVPVPPEFTFDTCERAIDPNLPNELFGSPQDHDGHPFPGRG